MNDTSILDQNLTGHEDIELYDISLNERLLFKIGYYLISIVSVCGNLLIIFAIVLNKNMHSVTNYFITNLAIVDIIISVFSTPFQVKKIVYLFLILI